MNKFLSIGLLVFIYTGLMAKKYKVTDFGAVGDGTVLSTTFIQDAIDKAHEGGGGKVIIPQGTFLSGTLASPAGIIRLIAADFEAMPLKVSIENP